MYDLPSLRASVRVDLCSGLKAEYDMIEEETAGRKVLGVGDNKYMSMSVLGLGCYLG